MVRQLLALIALLTGIAALGVPAQSALAATVGVAAEQSDRTNSDVRDTQQTCVKKQREQKLRGEKPTPCKSQDPVTVYIPSVMFGADRAYE